MSNEKGTWGGKREGAGRKQSTPYTSKTQGIYCNTYELMELKMYLAFHRCLMSDPLNNYGTDNGAGALNYGLIRRWMFLMMEEEDWEEIRKCLEPATVERLKKSYEKRLKKHQEKKAKK